MALLRYGWAHLSVSVGRAAGAAFLGTLTVNLLGCLFIGFLWRLVETQRMVTAELQPLLIVGFLGSFTTFSTFGNDTLELIRQGKSAIALANIAVQVIVGVVAVFLGRMAGGWATA